jgi:hypothetical protein
MNYKCRDAIRARVELYNVAENTIAIDDDDEQCAADRSALLAACDKAADEILALRRALQRIYLFSDYDLGAPPLRSAAEMMRDIAKTALQGRL